MVVDGSGGVGGEAGGGDDITDDGMTPWAFNGTMGVTIRTTHYRIHTNSNNTELVAALPEFCEQAYLEFQHFTESRTYSKYDFDSDTPLSRMDVYLLASRQDWEQFTSDLLVERAETLVRLNRGGFTMRGTSVYYDLGYRDTLTIAAHEGWHQFAQRYFADPLPVWLDEGIACQMESLALGPVEGEIQFQQNYNPNRLDSLISARDHQRLLSIHDLVNETPADFIRDQGSSTTSNYYAQVWALTRFLVEYKHGKYRQSLKRLLRDALAGTLHDRVRSTPRTLTDLAELVSARCCSPGEIFRVYIIDDFDEANIKYLKYINSLP